MVKLCTYKNSLGVPGQGFHSMRIPGTDTALFDYVGTILLAFILTRITGIPFVISTIAMFTIGIILHWLFCVPTNSTVFLSKLLVR